jgi:hypothetical protein
MECTMNEYGVLMIEPENAMEKYALGQWRKDPIDKEGKLKIAFRLWTAQGGWKPIFVDTMVAEADV